MGFEKSYICPGPIYQHPATQIDFEKSKKSKRWRRWRRKNCRIQIQAPPNAPRDEILPRQESSLLTNLVSPLLSSLFTLATDF